MKKFKFIFCFVTAMSNFISSFAQSAVVVSDPTSIVQRLALATEEMEEQIEQKYKFIQQIQIAQKAYEESKKMQERVEKVSTFVKTAKEVVEIITLGEDIMNLSKTMRKNISNASILSDNQKYQCIVDLINCTSNVSKIAERASAVVQDKGKNNEVALSDYERQQELRYLKNEMQMTKEELQRIYNKTFSNSLVEERKNSLFSFIQF